MATYYAEASGSLGAWARINGTWTKIGSMPFYANGAYGNGGLKTMSWYASGTLTSGGYIDAFRVTIDSVDSGQNCNIGTFHGVTWVTQSTSSVRSATPNGEKITATVRPQ